MVSKKENTEDRQKEKEKVSQKEKEKEKGSPEEKEKGRKDAKDLPQKDHPQKDEPLHQKKILYALDADKQDTTRTNALLPRENANDQKEKELP